MSLYSKKYGHGVWHLNCMWPLPAVDRWWHNQMSAFFKCNSGNMTVHHGMLWLEGVHQNMTHKEQKNVKKNLFTWKMLELSALLALWLQKCPSVGFQFSYFSFSWYLLSLYDLCILLRGKHVILFVFLKVLHPWFLFPNFSGVFCPPLRKKVTLSTPHSKLKNRCW